MWVARLRTMAKGKPKRTQKNIRIELVSENYNYLLRICSEKVFENLHFYLSSADIYFCYAHRHPTRNQPEQHDCRQTHHLPDCSAGHDKKGLSQTKIIHMKASNERVRLKGNGKIMWRRPFLTDGMRVLFFFFFLFSVRDGIQWRSVGEPECTQVAACCWL